MYLLKTSELAKKLSIHRNTVYRMLSDGRIPQRFVTKIGDEYRFNGEKIAQYLMEQPVDLPQNP
ncbi:MAG: helix-turn-helix domain-containing protein [Eggerthellaceae bacterium]|nr:helix-turn-helix domain-containing protein [Eggerthellaceae bacterium]